jgi:DNA-binding transcriptional LysR family regulator
MSFKRGHLLYYVTVAEAGQITRAARRLHVAQPALSRAITQLESDLGFKLLERHARGVTLTPAGEAFSGEGASRRVGVV